MDQSCFDGIDAGEAVDESGTATSDDGQTGFGPLIALLALAVALLARRRDVQAGSGRDARRVAPS